MNKFINFIIKTLIYLVLLLFSVILVLIACSFIFPQNNNISIKNTLADFQTMGKELIDFTFTPKSDITISTNTSVPTQIQETQTTNKSKYYYYQLDDTAKTIYDKLESNIDNLKKDNYTIDFKKQFNDLLHTSLGNYNLNRSFQSALDALSYDYPELFYIDITKIALTIKSSSIGSLTTYTVTISPSDDHNYLCNEFNSESEVNNAITKVKNTRTNTINTLYNLSDYDKVKNIHDALVNSLEYDSTYNKPNAHNIYGALVQKNVVCEGYAKAFKYMLDELNIENILVSGTATNTTGKTESHMWNYVNLNGNWYGIDATWDDPIIIGGTLKNNIRRDYFLKGYYTFKESHSPSGKISDNGILFKLPTLCKENYK